MALFIKSGTQFRVTTKEAMDLHERLPIGTYTIGRDPGGFFLEQIENFEIKSKLYGSTKRDADRILRTFVDRRASTGVLLSGEKGSGKTLLAKCISINAAEHDIPTVVINNSWHGEQFNSFLQKIEQPAIILFDEYEKVYNNMQEQEKMLTLLDGVYPTKKLFLLTCNDKWRVNTNMRNRPGRIFYMLDFNGLNSDFIAEYCQDNLLSKEHIPAICALSSLFSAFNFDMLKGLVEEMNRYKESPSEALRFLNVRPEFSDSSRYTVQLQVKGIDLKPEDRVMTEWSGNPINQSVQISYSFTDEKTKRRAGKIATFKIHHLEQLDARTRTFVFANEEGARLILTPARSNTLVNYDTLASVGIKDAMVASVASNFGESKNEGGCCTLSHDPNDGSGDY